MRNAIVTLLLLGLTLLVNAQIKEHNLIFEKNQTQLTETQKEELAEIALQLEYRERLAVFPLYFDQAYKRFQYSPKAFEQADLIAEYLQAIGFELQNVPKGFPSTYKGRSACVNVKYNIESVTEVEEPVNVHGLQAHYPEKPSQYFYINPLRDTIIIGIEGTKLLFEAGSMMSTEIVRIELKEYYSIGDYMKSGLPTVSDGIMIQTGGSLYMDAVEADKPEKKVKINQQKGVGVDFTIGKDDPDMEIFIKDPNSARTNWVPQRKSKKTSSWQMTETTYDEWGNVIDEKVFNSEAEWKAYQAKKEQLKADEAKLEATRNEMNSKLRIYNLGYINCDRFPDKPLQSFFVAADENRAAEYYLVFKDVRGVMTGQVDMDRIVSFGSVPSNEAAQLIAVSFIDDQAYFYKSTITIGSQPPKINMEPVDDSYVDQQLAMLQ